MPVFVSLLRAVNVGGSGLVRMDALRSSLSQMGLEHVQTLRQSGNVVFRGPKTRAVALELLLEERVEHDLGVRTSFFVRSAEEWRTIISRNPFPREAVETPGYLVLLALKESPSPARWKALNAAIRGREQVHGAGPHAYAVYPDGIGRSKLTPTLIERTLGTRCTARNWNTVTSLAALAAIVERAAPTSP